MNVIEKLLELGFELDSYGYGKHECICPFCSASRKAHHQKQKCAAVWIEDDFATYNCIHCGEHGFVYSDKKIERKENKYTKPIRAILNDLSGAEELIKSRGISIETAKNMHLYVTTNVKTGEKWLAFPYYKAGEVVNIKYRKITEKAFMQEKNPEPIVYNYDNAFDALKEKNGELIVVEGEWDCLTFIEAGYKNCVSIPAGSIGNPVEKDYNGGKFDFLKVSAPLFESAKKIILALDNDDPGKFMTQALIDRLGSERCMLVNWGIYRIQGKDANDFWLQDKSIIPDAINMAKPIPLRGIKYALSDKEKFEEYLLNGINGAISSGFENLDRYIRFKIGDFVTITGYSGSGKSLFVTAMIMNFVKNNGLKTLYCAFENSAEQLQSKWSQMILGKPIFPANEETIQEVRNTYGFIENNFMIMQDYTSSLTVDNIIEMAEQAIKQEGVKVVIIDPLNKLEYSHNSNSETENIGSMLNKLIAFTKRNNILTFLVAHPTKPTERKWGEQSVPSGYDISGSANFLNMSDIIITVHRKQNVNGWKSRHLAVMVSKVRSGIPVALLIAFPTCLSIALVLNRVSKITSLCATAFRNSLIAKMIFSMLSAS
mgnify:CR=1 FL=1